MDLDQLNTQRQKFVDRHWDPIPSTEVLEKLRELDGLIDTCHQMISTCHKTPDGRIREGSDYLFVFNATQRLHQELRKLEGCRQILEGRIHKICLNMRESPLFKKLAGGGATWEVEPLTDEELVDLQSISEGK